MSDIIIYGIFSNKVNETAGKNYYHREWDAYIYDWNDKNPIKMRVFYVT